MRFYLIVCLLLAAAPVAWSQKTTPQPEPKLEKGTGLVYSIPAAAPNATAPGLEACPAEFTDGVEVLTELGPGIAAPKATKTQPAKMSKETRDALKKGHKSALEAASLIGLVVNVEGLPEHMCLKKAAGYGLDADAAKAVSRYVFDPATREGTPFASRIFVEVHFKSN